MIPHGNAIKLFTGNSNPKLAEEIAQRLRIPLGDADVGHFSDGEISLNMRETVRGLDVFIIQSVCSPVNDNLMELLIMIDACKRASAGRITAVVPYLGYARQDRKTRARDPITAKLVADLITAAGADRVLTMDLHAEQIQGFFNVPVDHLKGVPVMAAYYMQRRFDGDDLVVVSPDLGSVSRARALANRLNAPLAIVDKRRPKANMAEVMNIIGDVEDKRVLIADDIIDTAGTIVNAAAALMDKGAKAVYACCTHGVLSGSAIERLNNSVIKEIVIGNSIPISNPGPRFQILSVAAVFAEAIARIYEDKPISPMFD